MEKTYQIGKITLTQQAFAVFIIGALVSLSGFFMLRSKKGILISLLMFAYACYSTYLTNCLVVGNCKTLAWVLVGLTALAALGVPARIRMVK